MRSHDPHPSALRRPASVVSVVQHLLGEPAVVVRGVLTRPEVGRHIASRHEERTATGHIPAQNGLQLRGEGFEGIARHPASDGRRTLFAQNEIDGGITVGRHLAALDGAHRRRAERISGPGDRTSVQGGIVERVAADHLRFVIAGAGTQSDAVHLAFGHLHIEYVLRADERNILPVGHAAVDVGIEPRQRIGAHAQRRADAVEAVDDQHRPLLVGHAACGDGLARKTLAALVHGRHLVAVDASRLLRGQQAGFIDVTAVVEAAVVDARIDHIPRRSRGRFERIHHGRPSDRRLATFGKLHGERLHGQRLHYVI